MPETNPLKRKVCYNPYKENMACTVSVGDTAKGDLLFLIIIARPSLKSRTHVVC